MRTLFLIAALAVAPAAAAPLAFDVVVNTASVSGTTALLDFQFNPGMLGSADAASATIVSFWANGTLFAAPEAPFGGVSGTLPGPVSINNSDFYNDYAHQIVLGSMLKFRVILAGPGVENPSGQPFGSSFAFAILDPVTFASILAVDDPEGFLVRAEVPETGGVSGPQGFASEQGVLFLSGPVEVPEPGTVVLAGMGLLAAALLRRRR